MGHGERPYAFNYHRYASYDDDRNNGRAFDHEHRNREYRGRPFLGRRRGQL